MKKPISYEAEELLRLLREQQERNAAQQETILKMAEQMAQLQHRIDKLLALLYGTKSEKQSKPKACSESPITSDPSPSQSKK